MSINIGYISSVIGTDIIIQMHEESNKNTYRRNGELYHGVAIRECIKVKSGLYDIVCKVEGEYLDETKYIVDNQDKIIYTRKVLVKPIGYIENGMFFDGNKYLPMIRDEAYLMTDSELSSIYNSDANMGYVIGKTLKDNIPYKVDFNSLFNKHIGIFGNTGSGKSNTLTKLYTELFLNFKEQMRGKSYFVLFDFNGEYTGEQLCAGEDKQVIKLNTKNKEGTIKISEECFWDEDILGLLFKATYNTQRPFLKSIVQGRKKYKDTPDSLTNYYKKSVNSFLKSTSEKKEVKELFISLISLIRETNTDFKLAAISDLFEKLLWHTNSKCYFYDGIYYMNQDAHISKALDVLCDIGSIDNLDFIDELIVRTNLRLINSVLSGYVQFEHISPLLNRMNALKHNLRNVISISNETETNGDILKVISFRNCNQDIKKILPLIIAKSYYERHKSMLSESNVDRTLHLIIDEAHNILSSQSSREEESWKDYRLDLFEEIIKEGRKFGVFMTIASQRPADISPTIMSQFHNFLLHRLVNDKDLAIIDNAISTLDKVSKNSIPSLPTGACIITGTSFAVPLLIQVERIMEKRLRPQSDDVDFSELWGILQE